MDIDFTQSAYTDYRWWQKNDPAKAERIKMLLADTHEQPFEGVGKPEPLKYDLQGYWSRRIDKTNRLVYMVDREKILVLSCKYHY